MTLFAVLEFAVMLLKDPPHIRVDMMKVQYLKYRIKVNGSGLRHQLVLNVVNCEGESYGAFTFLVGFIMFMDFFKIFFCSKNYFYFLLVCIFCLEVLSAAVTIKENLLYTILNLKFRTFQFIRKKKLK